MQGCEGRKNKGMAGGTPAGREAIRLFFCALGLFRVFVSRYNQSFESGDLFAANVCGYEQVADFGDALASHEKRHEAG